VYFSNQHHSTLVIPFLVLIPVPPFGQSTSLPLFLPVSSFHSNPVTLIQLGKFFVTDWRACLGLTTALTGHKRAQCLLRRIKHLSCYVYDACPVTFFLVLALAQGSKHYRVSGFFRREAMFPRPRVYRFSRYLFQTFLLRGACLLIQMGGAMEVGA